MGLTTHECGAWPLSYTEASSTDDLESTHEACGFSKLQRAIKYNNDDTSYWAAARLLQIGSNPNAKSEKGEPTLHIAVGRCRYRAVGLLLDNGADKTAVWQGRTALQYARYLLEEISLSEKDYDNLRMIISYLAE
jgi:ankyrin repeat protein